jgi:hypothetical protein
MLCVCVCADRIALCWLLRGPQVGLWKRSMSVMLEIMDLLNSHSHIILDDTGEGQRGGGAVESGWPAQVGYQLLRGLAQWLSLT